MRTLIAEDDKALQLLFTRAFEYAGFAVDVAGDGETVFEKIMQEPPDVLILDVGLPGMSGLELLAEIRQPGSVDQMTIIMVTGNHLAEASAAAQLADMFLLKPVDIKELVTMAERLRKKHRTQTMRVAV